MNVLNIAGYLGRDVETREVNGQTVANIAVAVTVGYGERQHTVWVDCAYWGKGAAAVAPYLLKGQGVAISGEFDLETFTRRDGTQDKKLRARVSQLTLLGRSDKSSSTPAPAPARAPAPPAAPASRPAAAARPAPPAEAELDDDIPF